MEGWGCPHFLSPPNSAWGKDEAVLVVRAGGQALWGRLGGKETSKALGETAPSSPSNHRPPGVQSFIVAWPGPRGPAPGSSFTANTHGCSSYSKALATDAFDH